MNYYLGRGKTAICWYLTSGNYGDTGTRTEQNQEPEPKPKPGPGAKTGQKPEPVVHGNEGYINNLYMANNLFNVRLR